ncbi:MAG: hypothetical protein WDM76_19235 [Limisphaerales bacterium]
MLIAPNVIENLFFLNHQNTRWWGVGYAVDTTDSQGVYSLYRYEYPSDPSVRVTPDTIFTNQAFRNFFFSPTNGSRLVDGVVHLVIRAYDTKRSMVDQRLRQPGQSIGEKRPLSAHRFGPCRIFHV